MLTEESYLLGGGRKQVLLSMDQLEKAVNHACTAHNLDGGRCYQIREEFLTLCRYLESFKPENILEIGCLGPSFNVFCGLSSGVKVAVDRDDNSPYITDRDAKFVCGKSVDVFGRVSTICNSFDFIFIDADHTYDGVKSDFEMYKALLSPRGIVAFHDIDPNHVARGEAGGEVYRFWGDLGGNKTEIICSSTTHDSRYGGHSTHFGGIGIWRP